MGAVSECAAQIILHLVQTSRVAYQEGRPPTECAKAPPGNVAPRPDGPPRKGKGARNPAAGAAAAAAATPSTTIDRGGIVTGRGTHVADGAVGQLPVPAVLELLDLAVGADEDAHDAVDDLLLLDALDDVLVAELELDGVAGGRDAVALQLDGAEQRGQAVELRRVLGVALGDGQRVREGGVLVPEAEVLEGRVASEKLRGRGRGVSMGGGESRLMVMAWGDRVAEVASNARLIQSRSEPSGALSSLRLRRSLCCCSGCRWIRKTGSGRRSCLRSQGAGSGSGQ